MAFTGLATAHDAGAQLLKQAVTLNLSAVSFEQALLTIEGAAKVKFFYNTDLLADESDVTLISDGRALGDILDELLTPRSIVYRVHEKEGTITLRKQAPRDGHGRSAPEEITRPAKSRTVMQVTGRVTDVNGQPMAGVNIMVKGTNKGTSTDSEGMYSIQANDADFLVFSFIGYASIETQVNRRTVIDVVLREDIRGLKEVVVNAGYYTTTKELQTGSIGRIEAKDIAQQPVSDPLAALQGRVAGLEVTPTSGIPGSNFTVRIRGTNSISSGNDPLYIIDGVPYVSASQSFSETSGGLFPNGTSPLNNIRPGDIESIEVLKDADATAIYGSRGANGVILITTKRGAQGKSMVDLTFYSGIGQVSRKVDLLNTEQYLEMRREAYANDGIMPFAAQAPDLLVWDTTRYTDWQDVLIGGTAKITDGQVGISGGSANTSFRIATGYRNETTVFPGENGNERISFSASIENESHDQKLRTSFSANYSLTSSDLISQDLTGNALSLAPNAPELFDENGRLSWEGWTPSYENPLAFLGRPYEANTNNLLANTSLTYSIFPNLEVRINIGYTNTSHSATTLIPESSMSPETIQVNRSIFSRSQFNNWISEPQINWKSRLGGGNFDLLIGTTFLDQTSDRLVQYANGFTSEALMKNVAAAADIAASTNYYNRYRYHAVFGRLNYVYKSRYIANITGRRDGSSRFGPGKQYAFFKAIGLAWVFSNEQFVKNVMPFLSFGKLKASYGTTGNDQIGDYQFLDTYAISKEYQGTPGLTPARLSNPNFAWEENKKLELGVELGVIDDRVQLGISYYRNQSGSQLVGQPLAPTTGFSSIQANFPATIENKGMEIQLHTRNIESQNVKWSTSINLTIPRNKLVEFPNIVDFPAYEQQYVVGEPLTIVKRYHYTGIDPTTGYYVVEDVNEDGSYNFKDRYVAKFRGRTLYAGLQNSLSYKGFQLELLFQYVLQEGANEMRMFPNAPGTLSNQPAQVLGRIQFPGDASQIQRFTTTGEGANNYRNLYFSSDALFGDSSFIRLRSAMLSYTLPSAWTLTSAITNARVFIQGQNLLTITDYSGLDAENPGNAILPPLRVLAAGAQLTF